jgi:hypothetical protein
MPRGISRVLASLCCVLLALPPGWCCLASGGECCRRPCSKQGADARKAAGCPECVSACCCVEGEADPVTPAPLPPKEPTPSGKPACCERLPTDAPKVERPVIDLGTAGLELPLAWTPKKIPVSSRADVPPRSASPPLHLLHCVWRC